MYILAHIYRSPCMDTLTYAEKYTSSNTHMPLSSMQVQTNRKTAPVHRHTYTQTCVHTQTCTQHTYLIYTSCNGYTLRPSRTCSQTSQFLHTQVETLAEMPGGHLSQLRARARWGCGGPCEKGGCKHLDVSCYNIPGCMIITLIALIYYQ